MFYNKFYFMPLHVSSTCAHHQEVKIVLHSLWYHHTYKCDDTRGCVIQFWPPADEHMCSKHVEAWNKTYCKTKILCIKLVKYWDKYTYMHGQQNVKTINWLCLLHFPIELLHNLHYVYRYILLYILYFAVHNLKISLLTIHHYFIYHIRQGQ